MVCSYFRYFLQKLNELMNYNKDDPIHFVRLTTVELGKIKILKILLIMGLSYNVALFLIEIIYFSLNFQLQEFIQFFSLNVGALHGYMASWICLRYEDDALDTMNYMDSNFIKLSSVKAATYERILQSLITRRYIFILNMVFLHLLFLFFWPLFGYEDDYYFPIFFFNEFIKPLFGSYIVNILRTFFYITTYSYVSSAGIQVHIMLYVLSHMEFQLIIVEDFIRDIGNTFRKDGRLQQRDVNADLKQCIRHYLRVKICMDKLKDWLFWPMVVTTVGSFVMLLSYVYFVIAQASLEAFPRVASLGGVSVCCIAIYALCGQGLVDQCGRVNRSLYFLPWYEFNKKNNNLLLLYLVTTNEPLRLSLLGFIDVEATLVMKVYKFVFSSLATIQQIVALRNKDD